MTTTPKPLPSGSRIPRLLTVPQVDEITGIGRSKLYELVATGQIEAFRIPSRSKGARRLSIRVSEQSVLDFLARTRVRRRA
jgi:predicted DNA-binding transcriptional regulator AlpA